MKIREYIEASDFEEICKWSWETTKYIPAASQFSKSSFIAEEDGVPIAVISILLTNAKHYCIPECLYFNPSVTSRVKYKAMELLNLYVEAFAKALKYKGLFCIGPKNMTRHYRRLGFRVTTESISTMYKELGG